MKLRLTESDLHKIIESSVIRIIKENSENSELIAKICQKITEMQNEIDWKGSDGELEIPLDENGDNIAFISYEALLERDAIVTPPDDVYVYINDIIIYDENNMEYRINDNGMIKKLLKSFVEPDRYMEIDDDESGYNESWA